MRRSHEELLTRLALNDEGAVAATMRTLTEGSASLDARTITLVRLAALVAVGSATASFQWSVAAALGAGATDDDVVDVLLTTAPIVGLARLNAAAGEVAIALGMELDPDDR